MKIIVTENFPVDDQPKYKIIATETLATKAPTNSPTRRPLIKVKSDEILKGNPSKILGKESDLNITQATSITELPKSPLTILGNETDLKIITENDDEDSLSLNRPSSSMSAWSDTISCENDTLGSSSPRLTIFEGNTEVVQEMMEINEDIKPEAMVKEEEEGTDPLEKYQQLQCSKCSQKYTYIGRFKNHKCKRKPLPVAKKGFACSLCPSAYNHRQNLRNHEREKHRQMFFDRENEKKEEQERIKKEKKHEDELRQTNVKLKPKYHEMRKKKPNCGEFKNITLIIGYSISSLAHLFSNGGQF